MKTASKNRSEQILGILGTSKKPISAYEIMGHFKETEPTIAPPTVYRALAKLTDQGKIHKLESQNAFVECRCSHKETIVVLAICNDCGEFDEFESDVLLPSIKTIEAEHGFTSQSRVMELKGTCQGCA